MRIRFGDLATNHGSATTPEERGGLSPEGRTVPLAAQAQDAYGQATYRDANEQLQRVHRELRFRNASAVASLAEGLEETPTLHRLGVFPELGTSFKTTNLLESVMARVEAKTQPVHRWRTSDQKLQWTAAALLAIEAQFRRTRAGSG